MNICVRNAGRDIVNYSSDESVCSEELDNFFNRKKEKRALGCQKRVATSSKQTTSAKHGRNAAPYLSKASKGTLGFSFK